MNRLASLARYVVAIVLVALLVQRADIGELAGSWETVRTPWLLAAVTLAPASIGVRAYSFYVVANRDEPVLRAWWVVRLTLIGVAMSILLPSGMADLAKGHLGYRYHGRATNMITTTIVDKVTSVAAVALMGVVGGLWSGRALLASVAAAVLAVSGAILLAPGIVPWRLLVRLLAPRAPDGALVGADDARLPAPVLLKVMAISVFGWCVTYMLVYCLTAAFGADISLVELFAFAPFVALARLIPISAGGVGLGEVTLSALLVDSGVPEGTAVRVSLALLVLVVLGPGVVGAVLLGVTKTERGRPEDPSAPVR